MQVKLFVKIVILEKVGKRKGIWELCDDWRVGTL